MQFNVSFFFLNINIFSYDVDTQRYKSMCSARSFLFPDTGFSVWRKPVLPVSCLSF